MSKDSVNWDLGIHEILVPTLDLHAEMRFFHDCGFQLDQIYPSDDPKVARMTKGNLKVRIERNSSRSGATILIPVSGNDVPEEDEIQSPGGTVFRFIAHEERFETPQALPQFEVRRLRDEDPWIIGRAGMLYRDLIHDRLGGSIIASHIRIPDAGPVPDMVHYHTVGFQLIYCYKGSVKLVYEDQGPPFWLKAGDCVIQPPEIRHRVLEASEALEVIEIGVPAEHMTTIDHEMELPTTELKPERDFRGQRFCHFKFDEVDWEAWRIPGFQVKETGINEATVGVASVQVVKAITKEETISHHTCEILFTFVLEGELVLEKIGEDTFPLKAGDAFVIPPGQAVSYRSATENLKLLEVSLPGKFETVLH